MDQNSEDNRNNEQQRPFPAKRRSIRDISLSDELRGKRRPARPTRTSGGSKSYYRRGAGAARYTVTFLLIVIAVFGGIFAMSAFARATLTVEPRTESVSVDEELAVAEAGVGGTTLSYEIFSLEETGSKKVEGGVESQVERSAQGKLTIYNEEDSDQALVERTRFESESGKIYRISNAVIVPAASGGKPGSLTVTVTADQVGPDSNLSSGRLTIPGLEGTDLFETMYAEVETAIEGGFVGMELTVSEADEDEAREEIKLELADTLGQKVRTSLPDEYILVPGSTFVEFTDLLSESSGESVTVKSRGEIYGVMLKKDLLASYLASENLDDYENSPLDIKGAENLKISLDTDELTLENIQNEVTLLIEGEAELRWRLDEDYLREAISGVDKNEVMNIAASVPGVRSASLKLTPRFLRSIPTNIEKIDVIVVDGL